MLNPANNNIASTEITTKKIRKFFNDRINEFEDDKNNMLIGTISDSKGQMYEKLIRGDHNAVFNEFWEAHSINTLGDMFVDFMEEFLNFKSHPLKFACNATSLNSINMFIILNNNDEDLVDHLILTESKITSKYSSWGFTINSIYFFESDNVNIPPQFESLDLKSALNSPDSQN